MIAPAFVGDVAGAEVGGRVTLDGADGRHAVAVKRLRAGEPLDIVDGRGRRVSATIERVEPPSRLVARVAAVLDEPPPAPRVTVLQAIIKGDRSDTAVESLTEAGADAIVPWQAERCVSVWSGEKAQRGEAKWRRIAQEAGKQSRRAWFPDVGAPVALDGACALVRAAGLALVLDVDGDLPVSAIDLAGVASALVVVGPEGGITPAELAALRDAGARTVRLGPTVLRASTAGTVAVGALLARTERWA